MRFWIEVNYYLAATGELEKAAQACEQWQQTYPRDYVPYGNAGFILAILGNQEKALEEVRESFRLQPNDEITYNNLVSVFTNLNR
jgi:tetratricopeptide (TPR) repeat protein